MKNITEESLISKLSKLRRDVSQLKHYYEVTLPTNHSKKGVIKKVNRKMLVEVVITRDVGNKMCEITPVAGYNTMLVSRDKIKLM